MIFLKEREEACRATAAESQAVDALAAGGALWSSQALYVPGLVSSSLESQCQFGARQVPITSRFTERVILLLLPIHYLLFIAWLVRPRLTHSHKGN